MARPFKALCDPKRLFILDQLRSGEKMLLHAAGVNGPDSVRLCHMKILCESGLVTGRQDGKWTHYSLSEYGRDKAVKMLMRVDSPDPEQADGCSSCKRS